MNSWLIISYLLAMRQEFSLLWEVHVCEVSSLLKNWQFYEFFLTLLKGVKLHTEHLPLKMAALKNWILWPEYGVLITG